MENERIIFDDGIHKCIGFGFDNESHEDSFLAVNQYLIVQNKVGILIDPGSKDVFDEVYEATRRHLKNMENLKYIFFSHQDPDVADSITEWTISTSAKFLVSSIWTRFMSHYGLADMGRLEAIYDKGAKIEFGNEFLDIIPAHFLHSPGNFSLYDSHAKILFSGDIGASVSPYYNKQEDIPNFEAMKPYLEGFHKRYMAGNKFCRAWVNQVKKYDIEHIAPQHGTIFKGEMCEEFLKWFEELECGGDLIEKLY